MSDIAITEEYPQVGVEGSSATAGLGKLDLRKAELRKPAFQVALLTGGQDRHYAFGLATALAACGVKVEVIGSDLEDGPEMHRTPGLRFLNLHGSKKKGGAASKLKRVVALYVRLMQYAASAQPEVFHILWNNQFQLFDRTLLMVYYKALGKKIVVTAHNVNAGRRYGKDSWFNRFGLGVQYGLADHIFVHTEKMKEELLRQFHVQPAAVTTIPYGINNAVPETGMTPTEAKRRLGIMPQEKTILFFGAIKPYKGLEFLVAAFQQIAGPEAGPDKNYRLIIAGERKKGSEEYLDRILGQIAGSASESRIVRKIEFIPDDETEVYFKAADVAVLPYTEIFQSGILFLAQRFGLPVIATDVGSFAAEIITGETGYVCKARDAEDIAATIERYFDSDLFRHLGQRRREIQQEALAQHSWDVVGAMTQRAYRDLSDTDGIQKWRSQGEC
ncbi:MAG TPA: glycosyltransferase family 4 protein [Candidatus Sulfotelmatobacter sp.]